MSAEDAGSHAGDCGVRRAIMAWAVEVRRVAAERAAGSRPVGDRACESTMRRDGIA